MAKLLNLDDFRSNSIISNTPSINVVIPKSAFVTHPDDQPEEMSDTPPFALLRLNTEWHLVTNELAHSGDVYGVTPAYLYRGMRQNGSLFVLPVTLPGKTRPESWYEAWQDILAVSVKKFVKVNSNTNEMRHEYTMVKGKPQHPWPTMSYQKWISRAFGDRIIRSADDLKLQKAGKKSVFNNNDVEEEY